MLPRARWTLVTKSQVAFQLPSCCVMNYALSSGLALLPFFQLADGFIIRRILVAFLDITAVW